jgi:hypothetical protein
MDSTETLLDPGETRITGLDYASLSQKVAKQRAKLAFATYDEALRDGDHERAEAARQQCLAARQRLKGGRDGR